MGKKAHGVHKGFNQCANGRLLCKLAHANCTCSGKERYLASWSLDILYEDNPLPNITLALVNLANLVTHIRIEGILKRERES